MKSFLDYLSEQKLKGDQHKLDVNKNGKLDKFDFMALKNNKSKKENVKKEYVDDQGKLIEKPEVKKVADYEGPNAKTPPDKKSAPYKAANDDVKSPTVNVEKNGLGEMGDKNLKYEPNTDYKQEVVKSSWNKTESFLNKTKNMSLSEFTKYMLDECGCGAVKDEELPYVTAYTTGKFQPHPPEAIKYVVVLANKNNNILDNMVHEMKSSGMLGRVLRALLENPEAYDELTNLFGDASEGPVRCKLFAKSMNNSLENFLKDQKSMYESVSSPVGFDMDDEEMDMEDDMDDEDMDDEEMDMEDDMDDEDMDDEDMDDEDMDDEDMDDEDMDDEDMDDEDMDMDDEDMDDEEMDMDDEDMEMQNKELDPTVQPKLKKKFAHNNLLDAMKEFGNFGGM